MWNGGTVPLLPHTSSWRSAELIKHRDNFTFTIASSNSDPPAPSQSSKTEIHFVAFMLRSIFRNYCTVLNV
jgi:hypothetical protein